MGLKIGNSGLYILEDVAEPDLLDMGHVLERFVAGGRAGGAPKVVNAEGVDTLLGEAESELFVEVVEAAHIGADDNAGRVGRGLGRVREVGGEDGTARAGKGYVLAVGLAGGTWRVGWEIIGTIAHDDVLSG